MILAKILVFFIIFVSAVEVSGQTRQEMIREALNYQRENYSVSQYRDIYKSFMQDYFGPGHILNDTASAGNYMRYELENSESFDGPDFEKTGFEGNFYRVNLRLVKEGKIPFERFFNAFVKSVKDIIPPDGESWMRIWNEIDREITEMGWKFENEAQDRSELSEQFGKGDFIAHHSRAFNEANNFHYRIISRDNFNRLILPLLSEK